MNVVYTARPLTAVQPRQPRLELRSAAERQLSAQRQPGPDGPVSAARRTFSSNDGFAQGRGFIRCVATVSFAPDSELRGSERLAELALPDQTMIGQPRAFDLAEYVSGAEAQIGTPGGTASDLPRSGDGMLKPTSPQATAAQSGQRRPPGCGRPGRGSPVSKSQRAVARGSRRMRGFRRMRPVFVQPCTILSHLSHHGIHVPRTGKQSVTHAQQLAGGE
jgi:hypothetical protein